MSARGNGAMTNHDPADGITVIQLTDTHLRAEGELVHGEVDTHANLVRAMEHIAGAGRAVDAIVLSGDLADDGSPLAYQRLRAAVDPVAATLGAQVVYVMGNHDERVAFGAELLDRDVDPDQPLDSVFEVAGMRIIALDSTIPGHHHGRLELEQIRWLTDQLSAPAPRGTLLVLHHPPVRSPMPSSNMLRLEQPRQLAEALSGTDVGMILCGHNHLTGASALAGVPVWLGTPLSFRTDTFPPSGRHRGFAGFGYSRIEVTDEGMIAAAVDLTPAAPVYDRALEDVLDQLAALAEHR
ncbi:metallophosphoesterase [Nocardia arizonensis]|uniref:metallophosphoesterase n=1 Tax=Nocardia arizonensis TaxID=1141647 RepID=UPI000B1DA704|nr:metallophosphoesterase [Nocardia arizonensis]